MKLAKGSSFEFGKGDRCADCHKRKPGAPAEMTKMKNDRVVNQNTHNIINVWRPD